MKRILIYLIILAIVLPVSLAACTTETEADKNKSGPLSSIESYKDIPGVTEDEINAIEKLKTERDKLIYGALLSTEAYMLPDGSYAGYTSEFCKLMSKFFGIDFELQIFERDELIKKLDSKEISFTCELTMAEERTKNYNMSGAIAERMLRLYKRADSDKIKTESDINGLKIGFLKGSNTANSISKKAYPISFVHVDVDNYTDAARMIENGEIDAFVDKSVSDIAFEKYDFIRSTIFFSMVHEPVSMSTADPELDYIISVLNKYIESGGAQILNSLHTDSEFEYSKYKLSRLLTDEEKAYIDNLTQNGNSVPVGYEHDNYPVDFYNDKEKEFQGITVDVLTEIGKLTGLNFIPAADEDTTWNEICNKLLTGEIPMAAQLLFSEERENLFIWSAVPYANTNYALISKADYPYLLSYEVAWTKVGALKGSGKIDIYKMLFPENDNLILYDTQPDCLDALARGEIDLFIASEYALLMQTNYFERSGYKINLMLYLPMNSNFGFNKNETVLCSIIDKAQQFVQTNKIELDWTGRIFDYTKKLAEERTYYLTIFLIILFCVLLVIIFVLIRNIKLSRVLKKIATHDVLTGIFNRRYFMEQAPVQIARSVRLGKKCFIIMYDLDHFKLVNDTHGHSAGDKVLREIAQRIKQTIRPYDLFGRYGGEEFIMLMCDTDKEDVIKATERVRLEVCSSPVEYDGKSIPITASFGIACAAPENDLDAAINLADDALYQAKKNGRNKVVFYES